MSIIRGTLRLTRPPSALPRLLAWFAAAALLGGHSTTWAQQGTPQRGEVQTLVEFDVEKDGGPLIVPVVVETGGGNLPSRKAQCRMLIDTGATVTCFHSSWRAALGEPTGKREVDVLSGTTGVETFFPPVTYIGPLAVHPSHSTVACMDLTTVRYLCGEPIDGLLGMDVLRQLVLSVDFDEGKLRFHQHVDASFGTPVPLSWTAAEIPAMHALFDRAAGKPDLFKLDTGSIETLSGHVHEEKYRELLRGRATVAGTPSSALLGVDAQRTFQGGVFRAIGLSLGPYSHKDLLFLHLSSRENCLGLGYLSRYFITFDFPASTMYLRPGRAFSRPDSYNLSSLRVLRQDGAIIVSDVGGEAPGFRVGDIVVDINGRSTREMSVFAVRRVLRTEGRHVFRVRRDSGELNVVLELNAHKTSSASAPAGSTTRRGQVRRAGGAVR